MKPCETGPPPPPPPSLFSLYLSQTGKTLTDGRFIIWLMGATVLLTCICYCTERSATVITLAESWIIVAARHTCTLCINSQVGKLFGTAIFFPCFFVHSYLVVYKYKWIFPTCGVKVKLESLILKYFSEIFFSAFDHRRETDVCTYSGWIDSTSCIYFFWCVSNGPHLVDLYLYHACPRFPWCTTCHILVLCAITVIN